MAVICYALAFGEVCAMLLFDSSGFLVKGFKYGWSITEQCGVNITFSNSIMGDCFIIYFAPCPTYMLTALNNNHEFLPRESFISHVLLLALKPI